MGLSTAEKNRRKRERKKRAKQEERKRLEDSSKEEIPTSKAEGEELEVEYVVENLVMSITTSSDQGIVSKGSENSYDDNIADILRRFHARASIVSTETEMTVESEELDGINHPDDLDADEDGAIILSNRKTKLISRPSVAELKNRVERSDLVEAHDVTAQDPEFLLFLKSIPSTIPVPRHWGRKRKYLQGKRGIEKAPFQLPDFIVKTGITEVRNTTANDETSQTIKKKNRNRVNPKMGGLDVDYRTLHDAFFKHQNKRSIQEKMTTYGDLYWEGKEFETQKSIGLKVGGPMSDTLREALGMTADSSPPPWLLNMQRYGPPPSYPNLEIPGLNAPLPLGCSYGYHLNGWGKPPVDNFARPIFGGNPFDKPGSTGATSTTHWDFDASSGSIVTSDGKTIAKRPWGALPTAGINGDDDSSDDEDESADESTSGSDLDESSEEEGEETAEGVINVEDEKSINTSVNVISGNDSVVPASANDLRKQGDETPIPSKPLYTVLYQASANKEKQAGSVFTSDVSYIVPATKPSDGMESVLSKAPLKDSTKMEVEEVEENARDLDKKFKF